MATSIEVANELRVKVTFTDPNANDAVTDPEQVFLDITPPEGYSPESITYEYGVDAEVERVSEGVYQSLIFIDAAGHWVYRWRSDGAVRGAKSGCFDAYEGCEEDAA